MLMSMGEVIGVNPSIIPMRASRTKTSTSCLFLRASRYRHPESAFGSSPAVKFESPARSSSQAAHGRRNHQSARAVKEARK